MLVEFCTSMRLLQEQRKAALEEKRELRRSQAALRQQLYDALSKADDGAYVVVEGGSYATLATKKGAARRITPASVADALRGMMGASAKDGTLCDRVLASLVGEERRSVVFSTKLPDSGRELRLEHLQRSGAAFRTNEQSLKRIGAEERAKTTPYKQRCETVREAVVEHLRRHDPATFTQHLKLATSDSEGAYILRAKAVPKRATKKELVALLEDVLKMHLGMDQGMAFHRLNPEVIDRVRVDLKARISEKERECQGRMNVHLIKS